MHETNHLQNMKVLYVEDEQDTREELHEFLRRRVGKIYTAKNGQEGIELYEEYHPDIIIADLFMPEMGGIEMVGKIKASHYPGPFVIITSAVSDVNVILGAVDAGIDKYFIKPIDVAKLLIELESLSERAAQQKPKTETISPDCRKQMEAAIKKEVSAFLKLATGKGPKDVSVFIGRDTVEITAHEILTQYEKTLLDNFLNLAIIEQDRKLFYSIKEAEICRMVGSVIKRDCLLEKVFINLEKDRNKLLLTII